MRRKSHVQFLGGDGPEMVGPYPTLINSGPEMAPKVSLNRASIKPSFVGQSAPSQSKSPCTMTVRGNASRS